jgi:transcription-repair coupling factor (superfamily II helicase)
VLVQDWKSEGERIKGSFAIAKTLVEKLLDQKRAKSVSKV